MESNRLLTPRDASEYLQVNVRTIYKWINDGELECYKIGVGRDIRIPMKTIEEYLKRHEKGNE